MAVHLMMAGWHKTGCGISNNTTSDLNAVTCNNCLRFAAAASIDRAWRSLSVKSVRAHYLQRAGFSYSKGRPLIRSLKGANKKQREALRQQMRTNPSAARLMCEPVRDSAEDKRSSVLQSWNAPRRAVTGGNYCPRCGGFVHA